MSEELGSILDFSSDIGDAEAPAALAAGDYPVVVSGAELGTSSTSGKRRVEVTFHIEPEDFPADYPDAESFPDGKDVKFYVGVEDNAASRFRLRKFCEAIGAPMSSRMDINEWVGKKAIATIEEDEYEGIKRERVRKVEAK